jgi:hypothetical protein
MDRVAALLEGMQGRETDPAQAQEEVPQDLDVLATDIEYDDRGEMRYIWFELAEREGGRLYRYHKAVRLLALDYIPRQAREQVHLLEKMRKALKGLYNAQVDFLSLVAGIFTDPYLGILQCYGVQGFGLNREAAIARADQGLAALQGAMANFEQSRLVPLKVQEAEWFRRAFRDLRFGLVAIGQPDPRKAVRGMSDAKEPARMEEYSFEQNEMLYRGLARLKEDFLNVTLAARVGDLGDLARLRISMARESSVWASLEKGAKGISLNLSVPVLLSGMISDSAATAYGESEMRGAADSVGSADGTAHSDGTAHTVGQGIAHTEGRADGVAETVGVATTKGVAHTSSITRSESVGSADSVGSAHTVGVAHTVGSSHGVGSSHSAGQSTGQTTTVSDSVNQSVSKGINAGISVEGGVPADTLKGGVGLGGNLAVSDGSAHGVSAATSVAGFSSDASSVSDTGSVADTTSVADTRSVADTVSQADTRSVADTSSQAHTVSQAQGVARGQATTVSSATTSSRATTRSVSHSVADSVSRNVADTVAKSDTTSHVDSRGHVEAQSRGVATGRSLVAASGGALTMGLAPGVSAQKSYQWEDHVIGTVATILKQQEEILEEATREGAYLVDNYFLFRTEAGKRAGAALVAQAFHGTEAVTPMRTRWLTPAEEEYIRLHAMTYTPSTRRERIPGLVEAYRDTTFLTLIRLAALCAPGLYEGGRAVTVQERIPPYAMPANMAGEAILGNLVSYETGDTTPALLRVARERMANTGFFADTRFGKSEVAMRMAWEVYREWEFRVVALDFGLGWRKLMNIVPPERYQQYGLYQGSPRPIRWNPLQIGRRIPPDMQLDATVEVFTNAGRMGPRQYGLMQRALRDLYLRYGVLTSDPEVMFPDRNPAVQRDPQSPAARDASRLSKVQPEERKLLDEERRRRATSPLPSGEVKLQDLEPWERQLLAIERSKQVDLSMWYDLMEERRNLLSPKQIADLTAYDGILVRLQPFRYGELAGMYGRGEGSIAIEDLAYPYGVAVLEGGTMAEYAKSTVLGLIAWHLYNDSVFRFQESLGQGLDHRMFLVFEEANKIISGISPASSQDAPMPVTCSIYSTMFRDAGKYGIYLGAIAQSPSDLPGEIVSSCNNILAGRLKLEDDRRLIVAALARIATGYQDADYVRHISRLEQRKFVCMLGLSTDRRDVEPMLAETIAVQCLVPSNQEVEEHFRAWA